MKRQNYSLIILLIALIICLGVFWFQFNNDVATFIVINQTEVPENGSFSGMLMDSYGNGIPNKTITFHKPGYELGTLVDVITNDDGGFIIENVKYLPDAGIDNYYGDFTFSGDDKYQGCAYEGNITVIPN
ncbi:MAG: hypothetical protein IJQ68_00905 [Methanobrevibacter sp.]|uniref:hypothetical protein n=1 Tax=Methanobrevibacter sp. TaxID=66852 RepID=UPI0025DA8EF7|nr:hypothetical protein [Methanobrevibacter sp.]MBR0270545.1 hypothetical protein [Methanobrevibacter sp.]